MAPQAEPEREPGSAGGPVDLDERLGEAIEAYLELAEDGLPPSPEEFAAGYPELGDELREALEGLALVRGLVGGASGPGRGLEEGRRVAGYRIVRELGRGGMGIVYEAMHVGLDRPVALKVLGSQAAPDSSGRRRFLNEAKTAAGLHHTHIVPVFDVGQVGGLCYYAMQQIEGAGLDRVVRHLRRDRAVASGSSTGGGPGSSPSRRGRRRGGSQGRSAPPLGGDATANWSGLGDPARAGVEPDDPDAPPPFVPPRGSAYHRWVAALGRQAAEALAHAHSRGVIHRDVKPSNLLVDSRGTVWVADFGLARRLADPSQTQADSLLGTPRYMSPEQAKTAPVDGRTDVYSLGATLYELLTLRPPFEGQTAAQLLGQITDREPPPPRRVDSKIPRDLETIVLKCLAKRPGDRYASAAELAEDLERYLATEPVRARRIGPIGRGWRFARRHPALTAVSLAAAVAVTSTVAVAYVRISEKRDLAVSYQLSAERALDAALDEKANTQAMAAALVRRSESPNRVSQGFDLLKQAAGRAGHAPGLTAKLRDEAAEFLAMRDVQSLPGLKAGPARGIAFGPAGRRLATLSDDGQDVLLWDAAGGGTPARHELPGEPDGTGRPPGGPWGGPRLAAAGPMVAAIWPDGRGVQLLDFAGGVPMVELEAAPGWPIVGVYADADGERVVTLEEDRTAGRDADGPLIGYRARLWDPGRPERPVAELVEPAGAAPRKADPFQSPLVAISPDNVTVATARAAGDGIALWSAVDGRPCDPEAGQPPHLVKLDATVTALAFAADGTLAAAGGGTIRMFDARMAPLPGLTPRVSYVRQLRFSPEPDGAVLAVVGFGRDIEVWDPAANALVATLTPAGRVSDLAFAPVGRTLAAAADGFPGAPRSEGGVSTWQIVEPAALTRLGGLAEPPSSLAFGPRSLLAVSARNGAPKFWSPHNRSDRASGPATPPGGRAPAEPRLDGPVDLLAFDARGEIVCFDPASLTLSWLRHPGGGRGRRGRGEPVRVVALPAPRGPEPAPPGRGRPPAVPMALSADGRSLVLEHHGALYLWRAGAARVEELLPPGADDATPPPPPPGPGPGPGPGGPRGPMWRHIALAPRGDRLYLIDRAARRLHAWDLDGPHARVAAFADPGPAFSLALSPDGATLAVGLERGIISVDARLGTPLGPPLPIPGGGDGTRVLGLAFAPDGRSLASGTNQGDVMLWRLGPAAATSTFEYLFRLPGHRGAITSLAFDGDGRYLATAGFVDNFVDIWNVGKVRDELARLGLGW